MSILQDHPANPEDYLPFLKKDKPRIAPHRFKSGYGQCQCLWCGHGRHYHLPCPVDFDIRAALKKFAKENGRTWKSKLRALWTSGRDEALLRQARNIIGPSGLDRISQFALSSVPDPD